MYGLIWRALPGPTWLRTLEAIALVGIAIFALFEWGYPWFNDTFIGVDPSLG